MAQPKASVMGDGKAKGTDGSWDEPKALVMGNERGVVRAAVMGNERGAVTVQGRDAVSAQPKAAVLGDERGFVRVQGRDWAWAQPKAVVMAEPLGVQMATL